MAGTGAICYGDVSQWPTKDGMAAILRKAGFRVYVGRYSVRVEDCDHFIFQEYGGDLGDPCVEADADTVEEMMRDAKLVSDALARAGIVHRFEVYDGQGELAGYLHFQWPSPENPGPTIDRQ